MDASYKFDGLLFHNLKLFRTFDHICKGVTNLSIDGNSHSLVSVHFYHCVDFIALFVTFYTIFEVHLKLVVP